MSPCGGADLDAVQSYFLHLITTGVSWLREIYW